MENRRADLPLPYPLSKIHHNMTLMYQLHCMPKVTMNKSTGELVSIEYIWDSEEAEAHYNNLSNLANEFRAREQFDYLAHTLHEHREKTYITCEETCFCWDIYKLLTEHE